MFVTICEMWLKSKMSNNQNIISTLPLHKTEGLPLNKEKTLIISKGTRIKESQRHNRRDNAILANDVIKSEMTVNKEWRG